MLRVLWRLTRGYRLRPWKSPYLRWRIETYSGLDARYIGFWSFWRFSWRERRHLFRYLRWAARMTAAPDMKNSPPRRGGAEKGQDNASQRG
jgi:hypothetical protein